MKAMILAAGRGERMRPLTNTTPKPLLSIAEKPILQYHLEALHTAGIQEVVINHAIRGEMIEEYFGDGTAFGVEISYSAEGDSPLETGGGIRKALPLLGADPFVVVNGDIWCDYPFGNLHMDNDDLAHLVLVENPGHNPSGDFALNTGRLINTGSGMKTFSGIGLYRPELFNEYKEQFFALTPLLREAADMNRVSGELYTGRWLDIGTPERLTLANGIAEKESKYSL